MLELRARIVERIFFAGRVQLVLEGPGGRALCAELPPREAEGLGEEMRLGALAAEVVIIAGPAGTAGSARGR